MDMEASFSLPSPTDTPYRTPSSSRSRRSREYEDMSTSTTPPPMPSEEKINRRRSNDSSNTALNESISPLDPRRFTPTLHANLVSEILSLRRDLEGKTKHIDQLEQTLQSAQSQNDILNKNILASNKEIRSVKRQMQLLEGGTLSAITDLSKERDEALSESTDLRKRFEQSQKRVKSHEDNADRIQTLWDREKEEWAAEKRVLETKVHVVEGRLKVVLNEVAHVHFDSISGNTVLPRPSSRSSRPSSPVKYTAGESRDRRQSAASMGSDYHGGRASVLSLANDMSTNLADELALGDIEEVQGHESEHDEGRISPDALPEERGRPASSLSFKARRILGLPFDIEDMEHGERSQSTAEALTRENAVTAPVVPSSKNVDASVQCSAPSSPVVHVGASDSLNRPLSPLDSDFSGDARDPERNKMSTLSGPVMVSSSCQTIESLPSPPLTPIQNEDGLPTILESAFEKIEVKEIATQTDTSSRSLPLYRNAHSRTETNDLGIPIITIIPPGSRSATPEHSVVLPPQTRNAGCQVEVNVLNSYVTSSMQTEEIRVDRRNIFSPHLMPGALVSSQVQAATSKGKSTAFPRRGLSTGSQPLSNSSSKRSAPPVPPLPAFNDEGWSIKDSITEKQRFTRSGGVFAGSVDELEELEDEFEEVAPEDEDVFNRPTARFVIRSGKLVSQERPSKDIGELAAASAGEALALETLRQSEDMLAPELRRVEAIQREKSLSRTSTIRRGQSTNKGDSIRRAAMISSGTAAHQSKHSQSSIASSEGSIVPPPIPIPLRYSSARVGKSFSEGGRSSRGSSNTSPTRQGRQRLKPVLRKTRSGPALSPGALAARRQRSRSPPHDARVSIVPEMPTFEMPDTTRPTATFNLINAPMSEEASAPRPSVATGPSRSGHAKSNSNAGAFQQTSVVDAIAKTMVGEWMFKYVRRRKSFGKPDKDWDPSKGAEELINNPSSAGVRHKRWVWVAPYERAVMWSSKQPTNGTALMGKSGRKLTIKSVLDVKDDNPMPKNSLVGPQFNRSILILTPQRALKFTATSQERHYIWLTALSFLSHSPLSIDDLAALPPPQEEVHSPSPGPSFGGSFAKRTLRDSIRLAKAPHRSLVGQQSFTTDASLPVTDLYESSTRPPTSGGDDDYDAAMPPIVRRYHTRQRSNTAPKAPPSAFRSIPLRDSMSTNITQNMVTADQGSSGHGPYTPSLGNPSIQSSRRGSEASALNRPINSSSLAYNQMNNISSSFFDTNSSHNASMTMRMDAFIEAKQVNNPGFRNLRLGSHHGTTGFIGGVKMNEQRKKDMTYYGLGEDSRASISPVDSLTAAENSLRYSGSTSGRGSAERDYFRGF